MRALTSKEQLLEKKKLILQLVRSHPEITRSQIKELTGISMEMVLRYIAELIDAGLLYNSGTSSHHVGRRATFLRINPDGRYFLGITYNAVSVTGTVIDFECKPVLQYTKKLHAPVCCNDVMNAVYDGCDMLIGRLGERAARLSSISVGGSGYIDSRAGVCRKYSRVADFINVPVKALLEARYSLPVHVEHIIKAAAIQYRLLPGNEQLNDFIYYYAGQGIGMASVVNGAAVNGAADGAGEIGHLFYRNNARQCVCGREGCFETEIGGEAVREAMTGLCSDGKLCGIDTDSPDYLSQLVAAQKKGNEHAAQLIKRQAQITAILLSAAVAVINPQRIVLSGELAMSEIYTSGIKEILRKNCLAESVNALEYDSVLYTNEQLCVCAAMNGFYHEFTV